MVTTERAADTKIRRAAAKLGWEVRKSRARLESIENLGGYMLVEARRNLLIAGDKYQLSATDVAARLAEEAEENKLPKLAKSMRELAAEEIA